MGRTLFVTVFAASLLACSSTKYVDADAAPGSYNVLFPSTAAAVATDTVQIWVFGGDAGTATCLSLVQKRQSHQALPPALITSDPTPPCDLAAGKGGVTIPFGKVSVLAVGTRKGNDFLVGCTEQQLDSAAASVDVYVSLASNTQSVPTTTCTALSTFCSGGCN